MRVNIFYLVILLISVICGCSSDTLKVELNIIPQPSHAEVGFDKFQINEYTGLIFGDKAKPNEPIFKIYLDEATGLSLNALDHERDNSIRFEIDERPESQYKLSVNSDRIEIFGGSNQALFYGFQTLRQLLLMNEDGFVPEVEIVDEPAFEWRGLLLDCSRHFMEKEFVKRYIDLLALYKMNVLHWHITEDQGWRIEIDKYPKLTEIGAWRDDGNGGKYGGFYTKDDIREIVAYATERGVMIVPEIELPGHSQAALAAYPQFSCTGGPFEVETEWGVFKEIYCAGNDSTFTFLQDVLTEVIELFPSPYIHIGGDEVPKFRWEHCEKCQRRIKEEGLYDEHELQSYFISRVGEFLKSKGKKMIGWDEIVEGGLPDGAIVQSWRGFEGAEQAVQAGHQAILSPTSHSYFDYGLNDIDLEKVYSFDPIPDGITNEQEDLILGGECNMWSERAPQSKVDSKVFPRLLAMAEVLWRDPDNRDFKEFRNRVSGNYKVLDKMGVEYGFETIPVKISTETNEGVLNASLTSYDSTINIFITENGNTYKYQNPIVVSEPATWSVTFGRGNAVFKDTIYQRLEPHLANGLKPVLKAQYNENYTAGGLGSLTNGLKGSNKFRDGNWQGYWGDDIVSIIDFGEVVSISELSTGFLQYNNAWIFFPEYVSFEISKTGESFEPVGVMNNKESPKNKEQITQEFTLKLHEQKMARYVRLHAKNMGVCPDWHDAAGNKSWLFIDEISVK